MRPVLEQAPFGTPASSKPTEYVAVVPAQPRERREVVASGHDIDAVDLEQVCPGDALKQMVGVGRDRLRSAETPRRKRDAVGARRSKDEAWHRTGPRRRGQVSGAGRTDRAGFD